MTLEQLLDVVKTHLPEKVPECLSSWLFDVIRSAYNGKMPDDVQLQQVLDICDDAVDVLDHLAYELEAVRLQTAWQEEEETIASPS